MSDIFMFRGRHGQSARRPPPPPFLTRPKRSRLWASRFPNRKTRVFRRQQQRRRSSRIVVVVGGGGCCATTMSAVHATAASEERQGGTLLRILAVGLLMYMALLLTHPSSCYTPPPRAGAFSAETLTITCPSSSSGNPLFSYDWTPRYAELLGFHMTRAFTLALVVGLVAIVLSSSNSSGSNN